MTNALNSSIARLSTKLEDLKKDAVHKKVPLDSLVTYSGQVRTKFDEEELQALAASIRDVGILESLVVRAMSDGRYEIVCGERRARAARMAGLTEVPVAIRQMDDSTADQAHLAENFHRVNLDTIDLAQKIQRDVDAAGGSLEAVATKHRMSKPIVSKLLAIAQGGSSMTSLMDEGVTADRGVLATVASLERKAPDRAKALSEQLKSAPIKANKRAIAEQFMQAERASKTKPASKKAKTPKWLDEQRKADAQRRVEEEPAWRGQQGVARELEQALITVELSPLSAFAGEFADLSGQFGAARLAVSVRHPDSSYAVVQFGDTDAHRRTYRADELRLLAVW